MTNAFTCHCNSSSTKEDHQMVSHMMLALSPCIYTCAVDCDLAGKKYVTHPRQASEAWTEAMPGTFPVYCSDQHQHSHLQQPQHAQGGGGLECGKKRDVMGISSSGRRESSRHEEERRDCSHPHRERGQCSLHVRVLWTA